MIRIEEKKKNQITIGNINRNPTTHTIFLKIKIINHMKKEIYYTKIPLGEIFKEIWRKGIKFVIQKGKVNKNWNVGFIRE